ncbi:MAG: 2-phospho-L-lactate transferase CofD family protein, partial [Pseudomonadota bacterium]|nr:2-phospho-L-lactate transferase CofD family protein [Pseudomonadota bacterium]
MSYFDPLKVKVIALSGGVGGAKLVLGLSKIMQPGELLVVTNTGDDFDHYGLRICPDTDTVFYSLAGLADTKRGWGRKTETWNFLGALKQLNGEDWFQLGDKDLALHMIRTQLLSRGISLSKVTETLSSIMGIKHPLVPVTDDHLRTIVITPEGPVPFQNYFVKDQCRARVTGFKFEGAYSARPNSFLVQTLEKNSLEAIIFCPSNPYVSLDPILSIRELRRLIAENKAPKIGVSPIISG